VSKPTDLLFPSRYGEKEMATARFSICLECPRLTKTKNCKECGCFMVAKTKLKDATCPLGKW
jgi:membrane protease subunit (stomatin/prohibitin family)